MTAEERVKQLENAIDEQMVSCHLGVFNPGDDPKVAIKLLMDWSYELGAFFEKDRTKEPLERLKAQGYTEDDLESSNPYNAWMSE